MATTSSAPSGADREGSASGVRAQIKGLADDVRQGAQTVAEERKVEGAERLHGVAQTVDRVADDVEGESPAMAQFVRRAARGLDDVSQNLKTKSVGDLVEMARTFAQREPAAFVAASAVAGFALSRLLKSSAPTPTPVAGPSSASTAGATPGLSSGPASVTPLGSTPTLDPRLSSADATPGASRDEPGSSAISAPRFTDRADDKGATL